MQTPTIDSAKPTIIKDPKTVHTNNYIQALILTKNQQDFD